MKPLRLAVLGDPVSHSLSPVMQRAALSACGIHGSYVARRVNQFQLRQIAVQIGQEVLEGANITMPHKGLAARLCDRLTPAASQSGSVNTWYRRRKQLWGESTDVGAVRWLVEQKMPAKSPVLLLGAGGAAAAAQVALGGRDLRVSSRNPEKAHRLHQRLGTQGEVVGWGEPFPGAVVINATPLGMEGEALPRQVLEEATGLLDMAYGTQPTPAVRQTQRMGIPTVDGIVMLAAQAELSFLIWSDTESPPGVMEQAARRHLAGRNSQ